MEFRKATPERVGIPSGAIERFVERMAYNRVPMHQFLIVKDGCLAAEAYWKPFDAKRTHRLYSCSKSYVSIAVGMLIGEGKLRLSDRVADFFPEKLPEHPHPYTLAMTVRDLLMMSTAHSENAYGRYDPDWVAAFLQKTPSHLPGTVFSYDTAGTVMLNAIVEKLAGQPFLDYLRPRLFEPLGVGEIRCVQRPEGGSWGGSGVQTTLMDFAKVGFACMRGGKVDGRQLIPEDYIRAATGFQIDNRVANDNPEWQFGYGYQFWRTRHDGFAMNGMGSQFAIALPEKDFLFVMNADSQEYGNASCQIVQAIWDCFWPHLDGKPLPEDERAQASLAKTLSGLELYAEQGEARSPREAEWQDARYVMRENPMGLKWLRFRFLEDEIVMDYENAQGEKSLHFGRAKNVFEPFPQTGYYLERIGVPGNRRYESACSAAFSGEDSLNLRVMIIDDYFGSVKMHVRFTEGAVTVLMRKVAEWFLDEYDGFASGDRQ